MYALALCLLLLVFGAWADGSTSPIHKLRDTVIYRDDKFYSTFPSIVCCPNGELIVAFRRAPERRVFGEPHTTHTDPNSYLMLARSRDSGQSWSAPELIFAHPFGGSQDPCLLQLRDHSILCSSYAWMELQGDAAAKMTNGYKHGNFAFLGGFILRSKDGGHTWGQPVVPPPAPDEDINDPFGHSVPAYNRGAMCEGQDGVIYWATAATTHQHPHTSETHLFTSRDKGLSWEHASVIASDKTAAFNETSLYETPNGDLIAFMRTEGFNDHTAIARSTNHGQSFGSWEDSGFQGHPHYALRLPNKSVLLVYGYRHPPFGVRARVLDPECTNASSASEVVLRDDGGNGDLGYPWAALISKHRVLVVYYFNTHDGTRHIAGTFLQIE